MYLRPIALGGGPGSALSARRDQARFFFETPMIAIVAILVAVTVLTAGLDVSA